MTRLLAVAGWCEHLLMVSGRVRSSVAVEVAVVLVHCSVHLLRGPTNCPTTGQLGSPFVRSPCCCLYRCCFCSWVAPPGPSPPRSQSPVRGPGRTSCMKDTFCRGQTARRPEPGAPQPFLRTSLPDGTPSAAVSPWILPLKPSNTYEFPRHTLVRSY